MTGNVTNVGVVVVVGAGRAIFVEGASVRTLEELLAVARVAIYPVTQKATEMIVINPVGGMYWFSGCCRCCRRFSGGCCGDTC